MRFSRRLLSIAVATLCLSASCCGEEFRELDDEGGRLLPTVGISVLVKNKEHSLPYFLTHLESLEYPKDRLYVWFYIDKGSDESKKIIELWTKKYKDLYNNIYVNMVSRKWAGMAEATNTDDSDESWTEDHMKYMIKLREKALNFARQRWADYLFVLDADALLTDPTVLMYMILQNVTVVAPMLLSDGFYSNFWGAMDTDYYYKKADWYEKMIRREKVGCFQAPMVHSAVLIDLRMKQSDLLTYDPDKIQNYDGPIDDIIVFAVSAIRNGIRMHVCNDRMFGFLPIPVDMCTSEATGGINNSTELEQFVNLKVEALSLNTPLRVDPLLAQFVKYPEADTLGLDYVFMINLARRTDRRRRMLLTFRELGIAVLPVTGVDGRTIPMDNLTSLSVRLLPSYEDPYSYRPMKMGEVGCFLSHFYIWKEIAKKRISRSLVLEDDVRFVPFFRRRFEALMKELEKVDWEFVYIGRKPLTDDEEVVTPLLARPGYSYWTLGYLISETGARKLIQAEPLTKMLPVDEFLPIMFDAHPNATWKSFFPRRDLKAYSAISLLVNPTHYTGEPGYISDTEDSPLMPMLPSARVDGKEKAQSL